MFVDAMIVFYCMTDQIRGDKDLRRELLVNLVMNFVLRDDLYWMVHNLTAISLETDLQKIRKIMGDQEFLKDHLHMGRLKINE